MAKNIALFKKLKVPLFTPKNRTSQNNIKEMFLGYYYSLAYHNQFITLQSLKQFWPFPPYNKSEIDNIYKQLVLAITDENQFLEIAEELLKKPWIDLYVEAAKIHTHYFRQHFRMFEEKYENLVSRAMFQVMVNTKDTSEETFLSYTEYDKQEITKNLFMVSGFWAARNYYKVIKLISPFWANEILQDTKAMYHFYLEDMDLINNSQMDLGTLFKNMKTLYGKVRVLEKIWHCIDIDESKKTKIDYSSMIAYRYEILEILEEALKSNEKVIIENISAIVMSLHSIYTLNEEVNWFKKQSLKIYEKYQYFPLVKQNLQCLLQL